MRELFINRLPKQNEHQIIGNMRVEDNGKVLFNCCTLELPDRDNKNRVSCIPTGTYTVKKRSSPKFGLHFHITDVPKRKYILIHAGNFHTDILGCVLVGDKWKDVNNDGAVDVLNSKKTLKALLKLMPDEFKLTIK